jgi:hypothetical protein
MAFEIATASVASSYALLLVKLRAAETIVAADAIRRFFD